MFRVLVLASVLLIGITYADGKVLMCYHGTWAAARTGLGAFSPDNIDPFLCTHIVYAFVGIDDEGTVISLDPELDLPEPIGADNFRKFTALKEKNPELKTILAVGGWNEGSEKYSIMAANTTLRQNFIQSALQMVQEYNFDGFDVDWEYPNRRDTVHGEEDIENFTQLLKELKEELGQYDLLVTAAVSAVKVAASQSYNISEISKHLDYIGLMSYDLHGAWDSVTGHNAALHQGEGEEDAVRETLFTVDVAVEYWLREGCPPEKLLLGLPFYGRSFNLSNPLDYNVGAPSNGAGLSGPYTNEAGFLGYNELCSKFKTENWSLYYDDLAKVPYAVKDNDWVSYDDPDSLAVKVEFGLENQLGGAMVWSIETDDFQATCNDESFPLLRSIKNALENTAK